jgi:hypothetical protein
VNQFTNIADQYKAGEITEQLAVTQIMAQMQGSGLTIDQVGEMIGYDPGVIRETAARYINPSQGGIMGAMRNAASAITQSGQQGIADSVGDMAMRDPSGAFSTGGQAAVAQPQFTDQEVRDFLVSNPDLTDVEIAQLMDQNGVTTSQIARASGTTMDEATRRYANARSQYNPMTGLIGTEQAINQGTGIAANINRAGVNQATGALRTGFFK